MIKGPHVSLVAFNIRSLAAHAKGVHLAYILRYASVLCLKETWKDPKQPQEIIDYQYCCGASRKHNRAEGVLINMRTGLFSVPIDLFGMSDEVGELCVVKFSSSLLVVALRSRLQHPPKTSCTSSLQQHVVHSQRQQRATGRIASDGRKKRG